MNPLDIVHAITGASDRLKSGDQWQASHKIDGKQTEERPKVTKFTTGLAVGSGVWFHFEFTEGASSHKLHGTYAPNNRGESIQFDDGSVEEDDVIVSGRWQGFNMRGVLEFQFEQNGKTHRYRFDATVLKAF